jgi:hypothetical protein
MLKERDKAAFFNNIEEKTYLILLPSGRGIIKGSG